MRFPIANVSIKDWNPQEDYYNYILVDPYIYSNSNEFFESFFKNHKFVDSEGNIFEVVDRRIPDTWWRKIFHFIPDVYKVTLLFLKTGETMSVEEVREFVVKQISKIKKAENTTTWINQVKKARTINEILGGA